MRADEGGGGKFVSAGITVVDQAVFGSDEVAESVSQPSGDENDQAECWHDEQGKNAAKGR